MEFKFYKVAVFVPVTHGDKIRKVIADCGAGHIGKYDSCTFSSRGIGRFRPLEGSKPYFGQTGKVEEVEEEKIEFICAHGLLKNVIWEIRKAHPYEEAAIDIYPLMNEQ